MCYLESRKLPGSPLHPCLTINSGLKRRANIIINYELGIMNDNFSSAVIKVLQFCSSAVLRFCSFAVLQFCIHAVKTVLQF
jgi:hypothetical protein